ncbi:histone-lysine N-methyltransferase SETMAR [Trichonephila clavipes]|nr:histone-lysine N-methyltransferase SETMAR [Trichonephila clavipes]
MAEIVNGVYGPDTVTANYMQFWFRRFRSAGFKKKLDVWVPHQLTQKQDDRISICEALAKGTEINPFLKRMLTWDEKWITYDNIVQKRSLSKRGEDVQTVVKPGRFYCAFSGSRKEKFIMSCFHMIKH